MEMNLELCRIDKDNRVGEGLVDKEANPDSVSKQFDTRLKNASIFSRGMQAAACTRFRSHTCGLSRVFSEAHVPGKNRFGRSFAACGRQNSAEGFSMQPGQIGLQGKRLFLTA